MFQDCRHDTSSNLLTFPSHNPNVLLQHPIDPTLKYFKSVIMLESNFFLCLLENLRIYESRLGIPCTVRPKSLSRLEKKNKQESHCLIQNLRAFVADDVVVMIWWT